MKKILLIILLLNGCAQNNNLIIKAPEEIMIECNQYQNPKDGTMKDLLNTILENKKNYVLCNNLNNAKKDFINNLNK